MTKQRKPKQTDRTPGMVKSCLPTFRVWVKSANRPILAYVRNRIGLLATVRLQNGHETSIPWLEIAESINGGYAVVL
jgi:hypothetical protein